MFSIFIRTFCRSWKTTPVDGETLRQCGQGAAGPEIPLALSLSRCPQREEHHLLSRWPCDLQLHRKRHGRNAIPHHECGGFSTAPASARSPEGVSPRQGLRLFARQRQGSAGPGSAGFTGGHRFRTHAAEADLQVPQMRIKNDDRSLSTPGMAVRIAPQQSVAPALT